MDNSKRSISIENRVNLKNTIKFLPLLLFYVFITIIMSSNTFQGDEGRYVMYATNLSKGYYSPLGEIYLWNSPGYPIILLPFVILNIPWLAAKLLNPLFLFIAIFYFYKTLRFYMAERPALIFSYMLGLYPPFCRYIYMLLTEQFSIFLVCGFMFHFCKSYHDNKNSWTQLIIASVYLGFLALTKAFFGYVILSGLLLFLILYILKKKNTLKKSFFFYLFALLICMPYLFYTYSLTGKVFYWGNTGGFMLYLMSSPYEGEFGDWFERKSGYHQGFYEELKGLSNLEREDRLKKRAVQNIVNHPVKYFKNWVANIGRLLFNYPFSYTPQKLTSYFYFIPNMFLVVFLVLSFYPSIKGYKLIPYEIYVLILFVIISFVGSTFLNAENRYFWPLVPFFYLWISFAFVRLMKIEIQQ